MLRHLRDVMAGGGSPQDRLDSTVKVITGALGAEVCSIYVRRSGNLLELCATEGLNREAVYRTRMRFGEGLVGHIAETGRSLALADAQNHPKFAYFPETGEEIYHSLMGVPIRRLERVHGVLVIQHTTAREYTEEEVESLETLAMVLAEMISGGEIPGSAANRGEGSPVRIAGTRITGGMAVGRARLHRPRIVIRRVVAEDPDDELRRLTDAHSAMHDALDKLLDSTALAAAGEHRDVLETYRIIASDAGWIGRIREAILGGLTAEAAVQRVRDDTRTRMAGVEDPYIRERLTDFEDVALRLLQHLSPESDPVGEAEPEGDWILIARSLGPAEILDYDPTRLKGVALEEGSATAHVAIVARALDIPVVGGLANLLGEVEPGDPLIVDGNHAQVFVRPGEDAHALFRASMAARTFERAHYAALRDRPAISPDGVAMTLLMNAGLLIDVAQMPVVGAEGIGLYRTEIPFLVRREYPDVEAQTALYRQVLVSTGDKPVTFRTLDAGGDKRLPSFIHEPEENPALGWRALRIGLDVPSLLRQQMRALIQAANGRPLRLMMPMVTTVEEFRTARSFLDLELERADSRGTVLPASVAVGAMVEVPAIVLAIEALAREADFLSIGSNDLHQFLFAADRGGERMAGRYDSLDPVFLDVLRRIQQAASAANIPVTVCGEMAGRPLEALVLAALGYRSLSMSPISIGPVKEAILHTNISGLSSYLEFLTKSPSSSHRNRLRNYLAERRFSAGPTYV
ncbi:Signal transduction protein containing GAF and PtsI domains [alpha proteobacterium BAL199]|nr:Signal transduction protein containing GAF and PtsI domains [alpha proteobacterium BAL199]